MIWENDIILNHYDDEYPEDETISIIVWDVLRWGIKESIDINELDKCDTENGEVIGNIFDNPELLEGGAE